MRSGKRLMIVIAIISGIACKQVKEEWVARYNGPGNGSDEARALAVDTQGNVYVTGWSNNRYFNADFATVKYSPQGKELWVARYNGQEYGLDQAWALAVDDRGNVYVKGRSQNQDSKCDYVIIKYNPQGNEEWVVRYKGPEHYWNQRWAMAVDATGNVFVTGYSEDSAGKEDFTTIKYSPQGKEEWVARYNGPSNGGDEVRALAVDEEGNVYVTGTSDNRDSTYDYATVKYNPQGETEWVARYKSGFNSAWALAVNEEGNVYVTGRSRDSITDADYATVKYNPQGHEQWVARYNGPGNYLDVAYAIAVDASGNVYVTGYSQGSTSRLDYCTVKYNPQGQEQWVARYNGPGNGSDEAFVLAVDALGNVYVTGWSKKNRHSKVNSATIKYDSDGKKQWVIHYNSTGIGYFRAEAFALDHHGNVYVTGWSSDGDPGFDYCTIKYSQARR